MNIIGAMLIMFSCTAAGIMKARSLSELDKTYGTLIAVLTLIKSEIATLSAPLDVTLGRAAGSANGDTGRFISQVRRSFEKLGEDSFCGIWCSKVCQSERFRLLRSLAQALVDMTAPCSARR